MKFDQKITNAVKLRNMVFHKYDTTVNKKSCKTQKTA